MSKHGAHVKEPELKEKYRVDPRFGLEPETGFPCTDYMVQKRVFSHWEDVRLFTTDAAAKQHVEFLEKEK